MADWLINDDGIRIPHVASTPSAPVAGSTQLYADSGDGTIYQRLPNGNVSPLASAASGLHYLNSGVVTVPVAQVDIDLSTYHGYEMLHIITMSPPFNTVNEELRATFDNDATALYTGRYGDVFGTVSANDALSELMLRLRTPDGNNIHQQSAVWVANIYISGHGDATTFTGVSSTSYVRQNIENFGGDYKKVGTVSSLNLYEATGVLFPAGFKWIMYGYKIVGA